MESKVWFRTCQECGNKQEEPNSPIYGKEPTDSWKFKKCKKCKSEGSLDYGSYPSIDENEYE